MTHTIGAVLIVISCALAGAYRGAELRERAELLCALGTALEVLESEICGRLTPLPEAARALAEQGPERTREFFAALCASMDELGEREFWVLWSEATAALYALGAEEQSALRDLGRTLGRYGAEEQERAIARCAAIIALSAGEARERARSGGRLYAGLGVTAGLLLTAALF